MAKHIALSLTFLFLVATSAVGDQYTDPSPDGLRVEQREGQTSAPGDRYTDLNLLLVGSGCELEVNDGTAHYYLWFLSIDEHTGTFRARWHRFPGGGGVRVNGQFTFVPEWYFRRWPPVPKHYRMELQIGLSYFSWATLTADLYLTADPPDDPRLTGSGSWVTSSPSGSLPPTRFSAEKVCIPG